VTCDVGRGEGGEASAESLMSKVYCPKSIVQSLIPLTSPTMLCCGSRDAGYEGAKGSQMSMYFLVPLCLCVLHFFEPRRHEGTKGTGDGGRAEG